MPVRLIVPRRDLAAIAAVEDHEPTLEAGEARLSVDLFGLTSNNITYGLYGEALHYWDFFPVDDGHGCVPVWGFATVTESQTDGLPEGARVFGFLPMAETLVVNPSSTDGLAFFDDSPHRRSLHRWYNRYYFCESDPVWAAAHEPIQAVMWALFMTGWELANELASTVSTVVVSSASSKTALSLAWSLRNLHPDVTTVGITSERNADFLAGLGVYSGGIATYANLGFDEVVGPAAFVDAAGSMEIKANVHLALGDRLVDSVRLGATHQVGSGPGSAELVGPEPRRFFIPDSAERLAAGEGFDSYHRRFADAWLRFRPWIEDLLHVDVGSGADAIVDAYRSIVAGSHDPKTAVALGW